MNKPPSLYAASLFAFALPLFCMGPQIFVRDRGTGETGGSLNGVEVNTSIAHGSRPSAQKLLFALTPILDEALIL